MIARVKEILDRAGIRYAVIGGIAMGARGYARFTIDFDFLTTDKRVFDSTLWQDLVADNIPVDIHKGDYDDPLGGVVRIGAGSAQVDIVVGKWKWEHRAVMEAEPLRVAGTVMPVARTSDLILMKLNAGGYQDRLDVHQLLEIGPREQLIAEVDAKLGDLPSTAEKDARKIWREIVADE